MSNVACPYCDESVEINHDDGAGYSEHVLHQQQCWSCKKNFVFTTAISFDYDAYKAGCLNDGKHQFEKTATYPPEAARLRCRMCGEEQPLPAVAVQKI